MHKFAPGNAARLERPERYKLIRPEETLRRLGLQPGMRFLDVGAGTGFFSRAAAKIVHPNGRVFSAEMSRDMLEVLRAGGVSPNMEVLLSQEYSISLPDSSADMALLAFVLHENVDRKRLLDEVMRILLPEGKLLIIEWKKQEEENGPPRGERLGRDELATELSGFAVLEEGSLNVSHYYMVVQRGRFIHGH